MPSLEENKHIVTSWYEHYSSGDFEAMRRLQSDRLRSYSPSPGEPNITGDVMWHIFEAHRAAFPDWHEDVQKLVAEGDTVAVYHTGSGTQRGAFAGRRATNQKVTVTAMDMIQIDNDGKIIGHWGVSPWLEPLTG
jgi:steroid delta-isomerase-like uncharacterized protein